MAGKLFQHLLKRFSVLSKQHKEGGFTILEVLISVIMGLIIMMALMDLIIDLLKSDRQEYGRSETQREMQMSLDFIVNDLREAAYVYNNEELNVGNRGAVQAGRLRDFLPAFSPGFEPILAFWKPEPVSEAILQRINCGPRPADPPPANWVECNLLKTKRRTYSLVVYLQKVNDRNTTEEREWKGISRVMRYELKKYQNLHNNPNDFTKTPGYVEPTETSFTTWPLNINGQNLQAGRPNDTNRSVLVDFVDYPTRQRGDNLTVASPTCPTNYSQIPPQQNPSGFNNPSFMVCVSSNTGLLEGSGANQDVFIFLRGNPTGRAGINVAPLLAIRTQAVARGVIDKRPN